MKFTPDEFDLLRQGLESLGSEVSNQIVTCPYPEEAVPELEALSKEKARIQALLDRIRRALR